MTTNDHLQMIGPWGWLGWLLFAVIAMLFYRQWTSDPQTAMRKMREELEEARKTIAELRQLEMQLKNRNEQLNVQVNSIAAELSDQRNILRSLNDAMKLRGETITMQNDIIERNEKYQRQQAEKIEWLVGRVVQMDAANAVVTKLPWN